MKPGFKTTEFWLVIVKMLAGAALAIYEPTRAAGFMLLGLGGLDSQKYTDARKELKGSS